MFNCTKIVVLNKKTTVQVVKNNLYRNPESIPLKRPEEIQTRNAFTALKSSMPSAVQVHAAAVSGRRGVRARVPSAPEIPVLPTAPAVPCPGPLASGGAATAPSGAAPPTTTMALYNPSEQKQPL